MSRYEEFYRDKASEAIDTQAKELESDGTVTNPFFVGYTPDELSFLWDVHAQNYGERNMQDDEVQSDQSASSAQAIFGLHDLVLQACNEVDSKSRGQE